ncbi:VOC family protein [Microlunatus parietis]|uniref:Catechol 2,3-dioxygenase-like lactoylglutathione lyase family enzyme n=1 Tax=Microlunatus parietis TaxID=682979 RepID=A0A7Y9I532_9ACTN|nr:VOC family protein [Microlunatus parietis]NYE70253.1 catechol 2,3-dioxygenase-like lactoylglutathione lyase family enzyme [Microlunatus parietis]
MTNLENLRKQAKQLRRWHREGYYPVAQRIRASLPTYAGWSDPEILARPFGLAQAQDLLAREQGFDSWAALVSEWSAMTIETTDRDSSNPRFDGAFPQLFVRDVPAACAFFTERLGFVVGYLYGEPVFYALVRRGAARLNLRFTDAPVIDPELARRDSLLSANLPVAGVKDLYLEYQQAGVPILQPLRPQPWGVSDFIVEGPDGNLLCFAETLG